MTVDLEQPIINDNRPVELDAFKIYRSENSVSDFEEDFEEGEIPEDWTLTTNSAQGWFITQDGSSAFWTVPSHTWYMCSNDDMADDDGSMDYLLTTSLNVSVA